VQGRTVVVATGARYRTLNLEVLAGFAAERDVVQAGPELSRIW
jgi:alkyl hydroperoxide reductase subunit AhpF